MDLLYWEIFILENLGFCVFTSFALLNNEEALRLMARLYEARTGVATTSARLLEYAAECIGRELAFQREIALVGVGKSVPEFTKVLYRYFSA
jgi:aldehyde:ferredoxin oxidoreductase